jgi:hypothetical protein
LNTSNVYKGEEIMETNLLKKIFSFLTIVLSFYQINTETVFAAQQMDLVEQRVVTQTKNTPRSWEVKPTLGVGGANLGPLGPIFGGFGGLQATIKSPENTTLTTTTRVFRQSNQNNHNNFNDDTPGDNKNKEKYNDDKFLNDLKLAKELSINSNNDKKQQGYVLGGSQNSTNKLLNRLEEDQGNLRIVQSLSNQSFQEEEQIRHAIELSKYQQ